MDQLLEASLRHGLVPLVTPELRGITVGGAFAGTAGESSSYKHGLFDSTVISIEIILADGTVTNASVSQNADLLSMSGGACGTLGVVTLLDVQLMDASDYVRLTYYSVKSSTEAIQLLKGLEMEQDIDFLDGILFSDSAGVIMVGKLIKNPDGLPVRSFTRPWDQHFYRHAEKLTKHMLTTSFPDPSPFEAESRLQHHQPPTPHTGEAIPIRDYLFRYDRGSFWGAQRAFTYFHVPFNRITRFLLDPFMHSRVMFHAVHASGLADQAIIQDVALPIDATPRFITWQDGALGCYPLWLCPLRAMGSNTSEWRTRSFGVGRNAEPRELFCNVGIWMLAPSREREGFVRLNRELEDEVTRLGGLKTLYAHSYYSEEEFWKIYDRDAYEVIRRKYNAKSLLNVYDKVSVKTMAASKGEKMHDAPNKGTMVARVVAMLKDTLKDRWPFRGLYGVWKVLTSREYLLEKEKST